MCNYKRIYVMPNKHVQHCIACVVSAWPSEPEFEDSSVAFSPVCGLNACERNAAGYREFGLSD
jgi:hypothetical protein